MLMNRSTSIFVISETDKAIEELISKSVREKYPEHGFIGEETVSANGTLP